MSELDPLRRVMRLERIWRRANVRYYRRLDNSTLVRALEAEKLCRSIEDAIAELVTGIPR